MDYIFDEPRITEVHIQKNQALHQEGPTEQIDGRLPFCPQKNDKGQEKPLKNAQ